MIEQPYEALVAWAAQSPDAVLVTDGVQSLTYAEALGFSRQFAAKLRTIGVRPGHTVAIELPGVLEVAVTLAVIHDAAVSASFSASIEASDVSVDWLVSSTRSSSRRAARVIHVDAAFLATLAEPGPGMAPIVYAADALCRLAFSSGSTGRPKAVALTLEMVRHRAGAARELWFDREPFMCVLDLGTSSGFHSFIAALDAGGTHFVPTTPSGNVAAIDRFGIAAIKASPAQVATLFEAAAGRESALSSLRAIHAAGGVMPPALREIVRSRSNARLYSLYGSTEAGRAAVRELVDGDVSIAGTVAEGTELRIVAEDGQDAPLGTIGRVRYRRAHQAIAYFRDPETTASTFVDGWFDTGDLGSLDESGTLRLAGRASDVVNVAGVKLHPAELELWALGRDGVMDAAGFVFETSSGIPALGLALIVEHGTDLAAVAGRARSEFGSRAPSAIFALPELPRTATGKVARRELTALYERAIRDAAGSDESATR